MNLLAMYWPVINLAVMNSPVMYQPVMNFIEQIKSASLIEPLGWTILHTLWQGAAIALLAALALRLARSRSANLRYLIGCIALLSMLLAAGVTLAYLWPPAAPTPFTHAADLPIQPMVSSTAIVSPQSPPPIVHLTFADRLRPILPSLSLAWLAGVVLLAAYHLGGWMLLRRLRLQSRAIADMRCLNAFKDLLAAMRVCARVRLCESALVQVPTVIGWLWPVILLPASAITGLSPLELRGLLAHELAHIRRHDYLANLFQTIIETLFFYHPAAWWIGRVIRQERENCCDDLAAAICDRTIYAKALATMETLRQSPQLALSAKGGALLPRIRRILGVPNSSDQSISSGMVSAIILIAIVVGTLGLNACRSNPKGSTNQASLSNATILKGHIVDAATGKPVPNVTIQIYGGIATRWLTGTATTDANGDYRFENPGGAMIASKSPGKWDAYIGMQIKHDTLCSADGQSWWDITIPADAKTFTKDFKLVPGGKLIGTVNNKIGQGDANVDLRVYTKDNQFFIYAHTDARGQFTTAPLFPRDYIVDVNDPSVNYPQLATVQIRANETPQVELHYDPPTANAATAPSLSQLPVDELKQKMQVVVEALTKKRLELRNLQAQSGQLATEEKRKHLDDEVNHLQNNMDSLQVALMLASAKAATAPTTQSAPGAPGLPVVNDKPSNDDISHLTFADLQAALHALDHGRQAQEAKLDAAIKANSEGSSDAQMLRLQIKVIDQQRETVKSHIAAKAAQSQSIATQPTTSVEAADISRVQLSQARSRLVSRQADLDRLRSQYGNNDPRVKEQEQLVNQTQASEAILEARYEVQKAAQAASTQPMLPEPGDYYVSGVERTGVYALSNLRKITLLQAIIAAGMDDSTRDKLLTVIHAAGGRQQFKMSDVVDGPNGTTLVQPGDVLMVAAMSGEYYIGGHVERVGVYSLSGRTVNLLQAIVSAGSDPAKIGDYQVELRRVHPTEHIVLRCTVKEIVDDPTKRLTLIPDDVVSLALPGATTQPATQVSQ